MSQSVPTLHIQRQMWWVSPRDVCIQCCRATFRYVKTGAGKCRTFITVKLYGSLKVKDALAQSVYYVITCGLRTSKGIQLFVRHHTWLGFILRILFWRCFLWDMWVYFLLFVFEMWCWRRMEISWTDHVRNEVVLPRAGNREISYMKWVNGRLNGLVAFCVELPSTTGYWSEDISERKKRKKT
jgi:hypothetical protein